MREICSAWEILSQQTIGVLVAAALPRAAWIAEINLHVGGKREALVVGHLLAAIPSQGATQLRRQFAHLLSERGDHVAVSLLGILRSITKQVFSSGGHRHLAIRPN